MVLIEIPRRFSRSTITLLSGVLILFFSYVSLQLWLSIFVIFMSEIPLNGIGMNLSHFCGLQLEFSNYFSGWTDRNILPLLILFHGSAFLFVFRARKREQLPGLPLEFGILNFLYPLVGTALFLLGLLGQAILSGGSSLISCETTAGFWPGLTAAILTTAGLYLFQGTGWLGRLITRLSSHDPGEKKIEVAPELKKDAAKRKFILIGGMLLLTLSLILLYSWSTLFFSMATARGGDMCWGTGCDEASWQAGLVRTLSGSFGRGSGMYKPFLWIFHISLFVFLLRLARRKDHTFLTMEFGILNIFWMLLGTAVFAAVYIGYKAATPVPQYPISTPLTDAGTDGPMLVITGPPAPPSDGCVIADETGWTVFDPDDRRCIIARKIPGWLYGKQLAWSGMAASLFMALGLSISQATGWLNRLIGNRSKTTQWGILFAAFGLTAVGLVLEFQIFQFHLLW